MFNYQPDKYECPFCLLLKGVEGDFPYSKQADIFFKNKLITALVASHGWEQNHGNVVIIPNIHYENIFDIPKKYFRAINDCSKEVALALKITYKCDGVSTRQHNGPDGGQDVWHYHLHVIPRYGGDNLYLNDNFRKLRPPEERAKLASKLRDYFNVPRGE